MSKDKGNKSQKKATADKSADKKKVASDYKSEGKSKSPALSISKKTDAKGEDSSKRK